MNKVKKLVCSFLTLLFSVVAVVSAANAESRCFYVTSYALENEGDGLSWASPMSLTNANAKAANGDTIFMKAGEYVITNNIFTVSKALTIEGGYAGTDDMALDEEKPFSVLTQKGQTLQHICKVSATSGDVKFKRIEVTQGGVYGMIKSNANCNLLVDTCNFVSNGFSFAETAGKKHGKALRVEGSTSSTIIITNSYFAYNCCTDNGKNRGGPGAALYLAKSKKSIVVDCVFLGNSTFFGATGSCSSNVTLFNQCPPGSAIYTTTPVSILRCDFRANTGHIRKPTYAADSGGVVFFHTGSQGSSISNSIFAGNFDRAIWGNFNGAKSGALVVQLGAVSRKITVYGSTFAHNYSDTTAGAGAITAVSGTIDISNCAFGGNKMRSSSNLASDIKVFAAAVVNIEYSVLGGEKSTQVFCEDGATYNEGAGVVYADPLFVTPTGFLAGNLKSSGSYYYLPNTKEMYEKVSAIDVHLLSQNGYVVNGKPDEWLMAESISPAIDAGNPLDDYSKEPSPNGKRINAGAYGNTPEASKTYISKDPLGFSDVSVTYPSGYSKPSINFTVTGDKDCKVDVTITIAMEDGTRIVKVLSGCLAGSSYNFLFPDFYDNGIGVDYSISGLSTAGDVSTFNDAFTVENSYPPWYGHGGEGVLHVWSQAPGDGSGRDWHNACHSWNDMVLAYNAAETKPTEIWFIDVARPTMAPNKLVVTQDLFMRGGFTYECDTLEDRVEGAYSVLDSFRSYGLVQINNASSKVTVENLEFTRSTAWGFYKDGAGDIDIRNCRFTSNALTSNDDLYGRGLSVQGSAASTLVSVSNCLFVGNGHLSGEGNIMGHGGGASFVNLKGVLLDDCIFVTNGVKLVNNASPANGGDICCGSAVYFSAVPATLRNCVFLSNHGVTRNYGSSSSKGGAIRFDNNCNGSVLTNCIIAGCSDRSGANSASEIGYHGGAITVTMSDTAYTIDIVNSTIAYNLSNGHSCPGGMNIYTGTVNLKNSIVCNNYSSRRANEANRFGADIDVKATGVLNAEYSLFTDNSTNSVSWAEGAIVNMGEGIVFGDALFATASNSVRTLVGGPFATSGETYFKAGQEAALTKLNLHLRGGRGFYDEKTLSLVKDFASEINSPAIDAGDKTSSYENEVDTSNGWHGRRVNLGAYGNTPWATMTPYPGSVIRIR